MKKVLLLFLVLLINCRLFGQELCFRAYDVKTKKEVSVICVGRPVKFVDCTGVPPEPDKEYFNIDQSVILNNVEPARGDTLNEFTFTQAGTFKVRQIRPRLVQGSSTTLIQSFTVIEPAKPDFTAVVCGSESNQVNVTITDTNYDSYFVSFQNEKNVTLKHGESATHLFTKPGTYKIDVTGNSTNSLCSATSSTSIKTLETLNAPLLESIRLLDSGISIDFKGAQADYNYALQQKNGNTFTTVQTFNNPANSQLSFTQSLSNIETPVCYRIKVTDNCGTDLSVSDFFCSVPLKASTGNNNIDLNWQATTETAVRKYEIYRNDQLKASVPGNAHAYTDEQVNCGERFCYQVYAIMADGAISYSNQVCETAVSNQAPPPGYLSSTFTPANTVQLTLVTPEKAQEITYQKKIGNANFSNLTVSNQLSYTDPASSSGQQSLCYQATFKNICNQVSAVSNTTCPIWLAVTSPSNNIARLDWSAYEGFSAGVNSYYIQTIDAAGTVIQTTPVSNNTLQAEINISENQLVLFRIRATGNNSSEETSSNTVRLIQEASLLIPNAFSPNGDLLNDVFEVKGRFLASYRMLIYDRWGQILFDNKNQNQGWDGRLNGKEIPTGAYPYRITGKDATGKEFTKTGTVTLLR